MTRLAKTIAAGVLALSMVLFSCSAPAASAGYALRFDGTNGYVSAPHNPSLNNAPLTVTIWFRTTNTSVLAQGLVSKYADASGNGWALILQNGNLRGFYYRSFANFAIDATSAGSVADGFWHQAALVVDTNSNGGTLYLDGVVVGAGAWNGAAGPTTSTEPLQIGRYSSSTARFLGDLDEAGIWNRALGSAELNYLKHRQLNGNEDGLVALWHFDEGTGTTASDSTGNGNTATLLSSPLWVTSSAPIVFNQVAGNALKFSGGLDYVAVPHDPALNAYPLTLMAWIRTSRNAAMVDGVITKYVETSLNGYSLMIYNGRLRAWYFRDGSNYIWDGALGIDGGPIADGQWHHVALVVDATGGRLYVDGLLTGGLGWIGSPGSPGSTYQLQIGKYWTYSNSLLGLADEVSVWNVALTPAQLAAYKNSALTGAEGGLVALWRLNESSGTSAGDLTGNGHTGQLINGPVWTGSTAFLGDGTSAIHSTIGSLQWSHLFAVTTIPAERGFAASAPFWVRRLDDFGANSASNSVVVTLTSSLQSTLSAGPIPLVNNSTQFNIALVPYNAAIPQAGPGGIVQSPLLDVEPQPGTQIDSVNDTVQLGVSESYSLNGGPPVAGETTSLPAVQVLHFDGSLYFGTIQTTFSSIFNTPTRGPLVGNAINTSLAVINNSGTVVAHPSLHYGTGSFLNVLLLPNGDAQIYYTGLGGVVSLIGSETDCLQNMCYTSSSLLMSNSMFFGTVSLQLPAGFSVCTNFSSANHLTVAQLPIRNVPLDPNLVPVSNSLSLSGGFYAVEETKPFWIQTSSLNWLTSAGQILIANPTAVLFVRQEEDDLLTSAAATLVDPNTANRVSNDGYYRSVSIASGTQVTITADTNGLARMTAQVALAPPDFRPHFPYSGNGPGVQLPVAGGGQLLLQDGLIDTANSALLLSGPVPAVYARDCSDTNCSASTISPAVLAFSANGNQLTFTPDGGLLAFGAVPPTNLTWGYAGSGNYAQRTSDVQAGAYHVPGTFLRSDQSTLDPGQWPAVLLFSGFGDDANPAYSERPGQASYADGFANYAGLNFRAPAQGQSYIAKTNTDWYPLTPRSKYYVRFGGVSGIHEAASFPSNLTLYGYAFTFLSYRLSYLDSENWESRTDGALNLPVPAGFLQEFSRMKFVCRGDLDSAQVPPYSGIKHLVYWNTDIKPQSIEFHPNANDVCDASDRFLVLGSEATLPFIPQAFHASLGFKNNGNLITSADNVAGADSRFLVPGQLTLQGPGGSSFPLETASDGYFNNWETPNRPKYGFFNLAGKIRVPFFSDVRVHLQVTPSGPSTAQIDIMGGWPDPDSEAENRGWNIGNDNYFNTAKFDRHADGWPQNVLLADYRQSPSNTYHPRAQQDWLQVAKFDYPLQWNPVLQEFAGVADAPVVLPVIDVNSRLKELSPGKVDFDFAQDITVQLPRLKVLDFVNDAVNEVNGPLLSVSNAIRKEVNEVLDTTGLNNLQRALREDASGFFRPVLEAALAPVATNLCNLLAELQRTNAPGFPAGVVSIVTDPNNGLQAAIQGLNGNTGQANSVFWQLNQTLTQIDDTLGLFLRVLEKDGSGHRHVVRAIIQKLVQDQGPALGFAVNLGDDLVNGLLQDLEPTLAKIEREVTELRGQFNQLRIQIAGATGDFSAAVGAAVNDGPNLQKFIDAAGSSLSELLATPVANNPDYFTVDPAGARQAIRDRLIQVFLGSAIVGNYQRTFRQFMCEDSFLLDQLMDVLFDQINRSIRDGLSSSIVGAQDDLFKAMKGIGQMSQSLLTAKIRGAPTFEGDSLRRIHLDANVQMNLPDEMHFTAFMDIKELTSQSTPVECIPAGAPAAEVTLGAKDVPLNWLGISGGSPLTLTADARWTLQGGSVLGVGGLLDIKGEAGFKGCSVNEIGATLAIGELENYFAAKGAGTIIILGIPVDLQAGIFAGHACSLDPLKFIDPEADQVLGDPAGFTGLYVQYGGGLSLSEILFHESSCVLDVQAMASTAVFYQGGPRSGKIGFRQKDSVDVSLFCVLSGHLDFSLGASATYIPPTNYEIDLVGSADLCGKVGYCPFCADGCIGLTIKGIVKDGGIDYDLDY